jgi:hypothetical protein
VEIAAYQAGGSAELQALASENNKLREDAAYLNERLIRLTESARQKQSRTPETKLESEEQHPAKYHRYRYLGY